jgi:hypothetical protein
MRLSFERGQQFLSGLFDTIHDTWQQGDIRLQSVERLHLVFVSAISGVLEQVLHHFVSVSDRAQNFDRPISPHLTVFSPNLSSIACVLRVSKFISRGETPARFLSHVTVEANYHLVIC